MKAEARRPAWTLPRWLRFRRGVQLLALAAFVVLFVGARRGGWPGSLANLPLRLDPLLALANLLASRTWLVGSSLALLSVGLALVAGRAWCGWLCPLGSVLDLLPLRRLRGHRPPPPEAWRGAKYGLLLVTLAAALFANLSLLILDPLTLLFRSLTIGLWPALDQAVTAAEVWLYQYAPLQAPVAALDSALRPAVLPGAPLFYRGPLLYALVFAGVIGLNALAERFWCRYVCPLGGLLGLLSKAALVRRKVLGGQCSECDACARVCPTGTIQPAQGYASDPGECTLCLDCRFACPRSGNTFAVELSLAARQTYDPGRRQTLIALGAAAAGVALLRSDLAVRLEDAHLVRPPGARENSLLARCTRCGACVRACPTGAIQPALHEAGAEGLWTPVLVPRAGYCDYGCSACGQVCPVQAIPPLSLAEKRRQVIGAAYVDQDRCLAWSDHQPCIICEEMCPVPDKAIKLETITLWEAEGQAVTIQVPHVRRELCIGCGICEYRCPVNGQAAIRVRVPVSGQAF